MKQYWADERAKEIIKHFGTQKMLVLEIGITPSGPYHVGHLREVIITDTVRRALEKLGAKTRLIYFVDDMDNLRKLYPFLPPKFGRYIHFPIYKIPSPDGSDKSYADYFMEPFFKALEELGIQVDVQYDHEYYESGKMTESVTKVLENRDKLAEIIARVSHRQLDENWQPFEPLDETTGKIRGNKIVEVDTKRTRVKYVASDGQELWADYSKGQGKLPWRIDWPARWAFLNIAYEPFGKEHAAAGGSYDVGREIVEKVYHKQAPLYDVYEHIYLAGENKKMSASLANLVSMDDFLQVVPPAVARYFVLRTRNERHLVFDGGRGLMQLTDEFARLEEKVFAGNGNEVEKSLVAYSQTSKNRATVEVPFSHLVNVVQAAQGDIAEIKRLLEQTGHVAAIEDEGNLKAQIARVQTWLKLYAPEEVKFEVLKQPPSVTIGQKGKETLRTIIDAIESNKTGIELHNAIYEAGKEAGLSPRETFALIYRIFIGKDSGPKAGFFLSMLDKEFVVERLKHYL